MDFDNDTTCRRQLPTGPQRAAACEGRENTTCHLHVKIIPQHLGDKLIPANTVHHITITNVA